MTIPGREYFTYRIRMDDADGATEISGPAGPGDPAGASAIRNADGVYDIVPAGAPAGTPFLALGMIEPGLLEAIREGRTRDELLSQNWLVAGINARNSGDAPASPVELAIARHDMGPQPGPPVQGTITGPPGGILEIDPSISNGVCWDQVFYAGDFLFVNTGPGGAEGPVALVLTVARLRDLDVPQPTCGMPSQVAGPGGGGDGGCCVCFVFVALAVTLAVGAEVFLGSAGLAIRTSLDFAAVVIVCHPGRLTALRLRSSITVASTIDVRVYVNGTAVAGPIPVTFPVADAIVDVPLGGTIPVDAGDTIGVSVETGTAVGPLDLQAAVSIG